MPVVKHDGDTAAADFLDQGDDGHGLADACRVKPDEWSLRARGTGKPVALATAGGVFLALCSTHGKIRSDQRIERRTDPAISTQRKARKQIGHGRTFRMRIREAPVKA